MSSEQLFKPLEAQGFIADFRDFLLSRLPTNPLWAENIALTMLSSVLGKVTFPNKYGPVKLNIGTLMIGPSGLAYKSLPLNHYVYPLLRRITEGIGRPVIIPSRYSVEGLIEYLAYRDPKTKQQTHNEGVLARDEFTGLFKEFRHKDWLTDAMEFLSELLDGRIPPRYTRKTGLEEVDYVYISFLSATTPYLYRVMDRSFFEQGTGNRLMFIVYDNPVTEPVTNDFFEQKWDIERLKRLDYFAEGLIKLYNSKLRYVWMGDGTDLWLDYRRRITKEANRKYSLNQYDLTYSYQTRLPELALKLAGLHAISRFWQSIPKYNKEEIMVMEEDMKWAINKAETHYLHFLRMLECWKRRPPEPKRFYDVSEGKEYLMDILLNMPHKMITQAEWLARSGLSRNEFWNLKQSLLEEGKIEELSSDQIEELKKDKALCEEIGFREGRGRPTKVIRAI